MKYSKQTCHCLHMRWEYLWIDVELCCLDVCPQFPTICRCSMSYENIHLPHVSIDSHSSNISRIHVKTGELCGCNSPALLEFKGGGKLSESNRMFRSPSNENNPYKNVIISADSKSNGSVNECLMLNASKPLISLLDLALFFH